MLLTLWMVIKNEGAEKWRNLHSNKIFNILQKYIIRKRNKNEPWRWRHKKNILLLSPRLFIYMFKLLEVEQEKKTQKQEIFF